MARSKSSPGDSGERSSVSAAGGSAARSGAVGAVRRVCLILIAGLALTACARVRLRLDALPTTGSVGAAERRGVGLVRVDPSGETLTFDLAQDAEVALVSVTPSGRVNELDPFQPDESGRLSAGPHTIVVPVSPEWAPNASAAFSGSS